VAINVPSTVAIAMTPTNATQLGAGSTSDYKTEQLATMDDL